MKVLETVDKIWILFEVFIGKLNYLQTNALYYPRHQKKKLKLTALTAKPYFIVRWEKRIFWKQTEK